MTYLQFRNLFPRSFRSAYRVMLRGRKVRRKAWKSNMHVYLSPLTGFVVLGGCRLNTHWHWGLPLSTKPWQPYAKDFVSWDWEIVL